MARKEIVVQDSPEWRARMIIEDFGELQVPFLHLDFKKWSPSIFKQALKTWGLFRKTVRGDFFAIPNHDDFNKWRKFVTRLGFEEFRPIECPDGVTRPCYVNWDKTYG